MGISMKKNKKSILFGIAIALILISSFTLINVLLYKKGHFDESIINISYTVICVALLINFLNSYLIGKNRIFVNLSFGKSRRMIFNEYLKEMLYTILIILGMYIAQAFITHYIWKDLIFFEVNYVYEFVVVLLLTIGLGFVGFVLGILKVNEIFTFFIVGTLLIIYFLNNIFVFNIIEIIYKIIIVVSLIIIDIVLFIISRRTILNAKIKD